MLGYFSKYIHLPYVGISVFVSPYSQRNVRFVRLCVGNKKNPWYTRGPLLTWFTFNPSMNKNRMPSKVCYGITYPFIKINRCNLEAWEWITPHFMMVETTYLCWDQSQSMLVKGEPDDRYMHIIACVLFVTGYVVSSYWRCWRNPIYG